MIEPTTLEKTGRFINQIEKAVDERSIDAVLCDITRPMGLTAIFGGIVPMSTMTASEVRSRVVLQRFPKGWAERYNQRAYVFRDPIVERLHQDHEPFYWKAAYDSSRSASNVSLIRGESAEFGLRGGFVVPIVLLDGSTAAVSFGGADIDLSPSDESVLSFVANYVMGQLLQRRWSSQRARSYVSAREYDCLLWAAEGKTDWEISVILGISNSTVTKHILSARRKLGATTKPHAVALAMRDGIIR